MIDFTTEITEDTEGFGKNFFSVISVSSVVKNLFRPEDEIPHIRSG
jgi:hypothetical protein